MTGCKTVFDVAPAYLSPLLSQSETISGNSKMPSPNGGSETGHSGDGACVISWILK